MNPLLNRIYQSKNRKQSKGAKPISSSVDRVLVPKLNAKVKLESLTGLELPQIKKTTIIKSYTGRLPYLNKQRQEQQIPLTGKKIQTGKSRLQFRSRRMSSHSHQNKTSILRQGQFSLDFPGGNKINFDIQSQNLVSRQVQRTNTLAKQQTAEKSRTFQQQKPFGSKKSKQITYNSIQKENKQQIEYQSKKASQKQQELQQQLFQYLNILQTNPDLNEQFCYMNRKDKPYSFYITDYEKRSLSEYLTVSLRGITCYKIQNQEAESQFLTIKEMTRDVYKYKKARRIAFFKNYIVQKVMNHWKISMFKKKFINKCQFLKGNIFSQNYINFVYFSKLHNLYQQYSKGNFFEMDITVTLKSLNQMKNQKMIVKRKQIEDGFKCFQQQVRLHLLQCLKQNMDKFRKQKRVTLGTSDKLQKYESFLPFDNKKKAMKFTQMAKLKQFQGYLYRIIKYTDLVRYNIRIQFARNSLISSKRQVYNLLQNYQNRNERSFLSWIQCHVQIHENGNKQSSQNQQPDDNCNSFLTSDPKTSHHKNNPNHHQFTIQLSPSIQDMKQLFLQHKQLCIKQLWNNHFYLTEQKDELLCGQHELQQGQRPSKKDMKVYLQRMPEVVKLGVDFEQVFLQLLQRLARHKEQLQQSFLGMYAGSFLDQPVENYLKNQRLRRYLDSYSVQKQAVQQCQEVIQFGIVLLRVQVFKAEVRRAYEQKYKTLITAIPQQVLKRTQKLAQQVRDIYFKFKQNPTKIQQFIQFYKFFHEQKSRLFLVEQRIEDLFELESMMHKNGIKIADISKNHIKDSQVLFKELEKRFLQIEENQEKERRTFQIKIQALIPMIEQKAQGLLKEIQLDDLINNPSSAILDVMQKIQDFTVIFDKIKSKKQELFLYQIQLNLGHKDLESYFKLEIVFDWYIKLWNGHKKYLQIQAITKEKGYGQIQNLDTSSMTEQLKYIQNAQSDIQAIDLLNQFKNKAIKILHVVKLARLIMTETFQPEHHEQIRQIMKFDVKRIKDLLFTREGSRTISCQDFYVNTNISQIQNQVAQIAFLSAQQSLIKGKLTEIEQFWKKTKVKFISEQIVGNGVQTTHLDRNEDLHQKIGLFNLTLKNIQSSQYCQGPLLSRLQTQIQITIYLRKLFQTWQQVQNQWLKLLPMMTNSPSVKHQSNIYFQFTSVDSVMKKLVKQTSDMSSMRKLVDDYQDRKNVNVLEKCGLQLSNINRILQNFLGVKRATYNRFYFLTDEELISIIQNVKDSKSFAKYGGFCFNCDEIDMDNQLINGFRTQNQINKLRKVMLRGEPEEMFKSISQNMKSSMKFAVRNLLPKMLISTNIEQQLRQNSLQVCLLCDLLVWTQMAQNYLNATSYEQYLLITKKPAQQMARLLPKVGKDLWLKVAIRLCQASHLRDVSEAFTQEQVTKNDFKWKQQIKFSSQEDQIAIRQFDFKMVHGLQYYPPQRMHIPTLNTERFLCQSYYACINSKFMVVNGQEGQGKRNLIRYTASRVGIYHREVVCNPSLKINYLMRFVEGAVLAGAWLSFYECSNLKGQVVYQLFDNISQLKAQDKCHPKTLFMIADHGYESQRISMFKYHSYTVIQPQRIRICQCLLQMYKFRQWQELSKKITSFLQTIKPLMQNIMGSHLSLIRKIVDGAGRMKINGKGSDSQNLMVVEMIRREIIDKSEENVEILLKKALVSYFNAQEKTTDSKRKYFEKLGILKQIISRKDSKNIMVIGNRSCKSTLIKQAVKGLDLEGLFVYPQTQGQFFTSYSIDFLNVMSAEKVLIYDGDTVISDFSDIITSGYLLIQGRKVVIRQKIILQLRSIQNYSPSFIQNCQIVYIGNIVSKVQKFLKYCPMDKEGEVFKIFEEIFGQQLTRLNECDIETVAKFINRYKDISQTRSIHRIIIWLMSALKQEDMWQKNYAGKHTDFTVHQKFLQLVPIDHTRTSFVSHYETNFHYVPTKSSVLVTQLTYCLLNSGLHVQIYGNQQIGKTSLLKFLKGTKVHLHTCNKTQYWSEYLKDKLLVVRRQGRNHLMPIGGQSYRIIVDDLDLGLQAHCSFVRGLVQSSQIGDKKYHLYQLQSFGVVVSARQQYLQGKIDSALVKVPLVNQSKQSLTTIFLSNVHNFVKVHKMNREVVDFFERTALNIFLITFDDLSNHYPPNVATSHLISILKDLLSIPKKNSYISVQDFSSLFKSLFYQKLLQKSFSRKLKCQLQSIYDNIANVAFNGSQDWEYWVNFQHHYKKITLAEIISVIKAKSPQSILYKQMAQDVIFINNQLQGVNSKITVVGRKGVGKRHISKISACLNKLQCYETIKDVIFSAIRNQSCLLLQQVKRDTPTMFQLLNQCQIDKDLQKFIQIQQKQKFRQSMNSSNGFQSVQIIAKIKRLVKNIVLVDDRNQYLKICQKFREFNQFSVCILQEWPIEAIMGVYKTVDNNQKIHAQIFTSTNVILVRNGLNSMPMAFYEKYIQIFTEIYERKKNALEQKQQNLNKIYNKFNQSCMLIRQWQQRIGILQEQITQKIEDLSKSIQINKLNAFVNFVLSKQLSQKQTQIKGRKDLIQQKKNEIKSQVQYTKKILDKIGKIINSLQRTEMSQLKKIYKTNKLVQFGLECLCILLKDKQDDVSQKTINKLLADSNLLMKMKSPDVLEVKNMFLVAKFKKQMVQHQHAMKTHTTQTTKILVEWIKSIIQYWETTEIYNQKEKDFKVLQNSYNSVKADFDRISQDLKNINARALRIIKDLQNFEEEKIQKENQLLSLNGRLENSSEIIPILLKAEEQTQKTISKIRVSLTDLVGNAVLVAFTAVYLPLRRLSIKHKMLEQTKRILRQNFIPFSEFFINQVVSQNIVAKDLNDDKNTVQDLNIYLVQNVTSRLRIIIDPQRKALNFLQNYQKKDLHHINQSIIQNAEELKQGDFDSLKVYHSVSQNLLIQTEKCLLVDWKTIQTNPQQRFFNRIAYSKRPQYFMRKKQLSRNIQSNFLKLDTMKEQLYLQICKSNLKILEDASFIKNGQKLIQLQEQTKRISVQVQLQIQLIKNLEKQINQQVRLIFGLLRLFKEIRPVSLDLMLDAASRQGDSVQNVISWALANLQSQQRNGWILAIANEFTGKVNQHLLHSIVVNQPLRHTQIKTKKPLLVSIKHWQKLLKLSSYTQNLKSMLEVVQKHQKQFQAWVNDFQPTMPASLIPQNLSFNEHLFFVFHLKPKLFPQSVEILVKKALEKYSIKAQKNLNIFVQTNQLFPVIWYSTLFPLQMLCGQINARKLQKIRIGSIKSQSQMRKNIWKCMQNRQWMILYGITSHQDINLMQRMIYYVINYQPHPGFRVVIMVDQSRCNRQQTLLKSSKYITSTSVHLYQQMSQYGQLVKYFQLQNESAFQPMGNAQNQGGADVMFQELASRTPYSSFRNTPGSSSRNRNRQHSLYQGDSNKISKLSSFNKDSIIVTQLNARQEGNNLSEQNDTPDNASVVISSKKTAHKFLARLYKHLLLANIVLSKRFPLTLKSNPLQALRRSIQILRYIEKNSIPIEFNVYLIVNYLGKIYSNGLGHSDGKCMEEIMDRIVDQVKFGQRFVYGVNVVSFEDVDRSIEGNFGIIGADESFFLRRGQEECKNTLNVLQQLIGPPDIKQETIFLRLTLARIPVRLSHKQITNQNYLDFYLKQQRIHNNLLRSTEVLLDWVNTYSSKSDNGQQIQLCNQYNWQNLMRQLTKLMGFEFNRNQLRQNVTNFAYGLKQTHDFLLYFNPNLVSFSINPHSIHNFQAFISAYTINYLSRGQISDAYNYIPNLQFKRVGSSGERTQITQFMTQYSTDGLIMSNLRFRDFKFNPELRSIEALGGSLDGQEKTPLVLFKLRKLTYNQKQEEETIVNLPVKLKTTLRAKQTDMTLLNIQFMCNSIYQEFYMRDNCLIVQDIKKS